MFFGRAKAPCGSEIVRSAAFSSMKPASDNELHRCVRGDRGELIVQPEIQIERPCSVPSRRVERRLTQDVLEQTSAPRNQPATRCCPPRRACPKSVFPPTYGFHPRTAGQGRPWAKRYRPPRRAEMPRQPIKGLAMGPWHEREQLRKARGSGRNQLAHGDNHGIRSPRGVSPSPPWRATSKARLRNSGSTAKRARLGISPRAGLQGSQGVALRRIGRFPGGI